MNVLHIAASHDSTEIVEMLLSQGFPVDVQDQVIFAAHIPNAICFTVVWRDCTSCSIQVGQYQSATITDGVWS